MKAVLFLWIATLLLGGPVAAQEAPANRLWWAEFALKGPLEGVQVDCGRDGTLSLELNLRSGEERTLQLPLPVDSPLGAQGLEGIPLALSWEGAGDAHFVAWSRPQPSDRYGRLSPGLRGRTRPPAGRTLGGLGAGSFGLFLGSLVLVWSARRKPVLMLLFAFLSAGSLGWIGAGRGAVQAGIEILDLDLDLAAGFEARSSWGLLELSGQRLEIRPAHGKLRFQMRLQGGQVSGEALAEEHVLVILKTTGFVDYQPQSNPGADLEQVWVRSAGGDWSFRGAWPAQTALGQAGVWSDAPPSWLLAGTAPGRGLLIGRFSGARERWIRALGFSAP